MSEVEARKAVIGSPDNFWVYSSINGFDLTHPSSPDTRTINPHVRLKTRTDNVAIDPAKSALVVVDMQNFFLSPHLGRPKDGKGIKASNALLEHAIPGCRRAGIRIIWLNWGLTQQEINHMPPAILRAFGFSTIPHDVPFEASKESAKSVGDGEEGTKGPGSDLGPVKLDNGEKVDGGRMLMRDQWNTALYDPLEAARQEGLKGKCIREDVWIHKNNISGLYGGETQCTEYLKSQGIRTLLFAGVNTDQCVGSSLQDAYTKGYDCLLLSDGSATTSPESAQQCVEANVERIYGFVLSCKDLAEGCANMQY